MQSTTTSFQKTRLMPRWWAFALLLVGTLALPSCKNDEKIFKEGPTELSADVAYDWIDLQLELTKSTPGFSAPVAASPRAMNHDPAPAISAPEIVVETT